MKDLGLRKVLNFYFSTTSTVFFYRPGAAGCAGICFPQNSIELGGAICQYRWYHRCVFLSRVV